MKSMKQQNTPQNKPPFLLPKHDDCAKELFRNPIILKHFLSDILGIPPGEIRSLKLLNPFLYRHYRNSKPGILDILTELNNHTKINIEIQLKVMKAWDKRQLFYLSKIYSSDLYIGENYSRLKRCIVIGILDFKWSSQPEYHTIYHLRDKKGNLFSDLFEVHILELKKPLNGSSPMDDWIRLFNAESWEDLDMINTKNPGILEAIREMKRMGLSRSFRIIYEARMKEIRDARAIEEYMREERREKLKEARKAGREQGMKQGLAQGMQEGLAQGREQGMAQGMEQGLAQGMEMTKKILRLSAQGLPAREISKRTDIPLPLVEKVLNDE